jgi:hypothetical protein
MDSSFISIQGMVEILRIANLASSGSSSSQLFFYDIQNDNLLNYSFSDDAMVLLFKSIKRSQSLYGMPLILAYLSVKWKLKHQVS